MRSVHPRRHSMLTSMLLLLQLSGAIGQLCTILHIEATATVAAHADAERAASAAHGVSARARGLRKLFNFIFHGHNPHGHHPHSPLHFFSAGLCTNTCQYAFDSDCDDGGPGAQYTACSLGTDCVDCGPRSSSHGHTPHGLSPHSHHPHTPHIHYPPPPPPSPPYSPPPSSDGSTDVDLISARELEPYAYPGGPLDAYTGEDGRWGRWSQDVEKSWMHNDSRRHLGARRQMQYCSPSCCVCACCSYTYGCCYTPHYHHPHHPHHPHTHNHHPHHPHHPHSPCPHSHSPSSSCDNNVQSGLIYSGTSTCAPCSACAVGSSCCS